MVEVEVEYLKDPPYGGNRHYASEYGRKQMIAAGHEIERLRAAAGGERGGEAERLRKALEKIAPHGYGLEQNATDEEAAEYWAGVALHYRDIARAALKGGEAGGEPQTLPAKSDET